MMQRRSFLQCVGWTLAGTGFLSTAGAEESIRLISEVTAARRDVRTLVASFEQVRRIGLLATDVVSRGKMVLVSPDRLRWELLPPDSVTYWVGPEGLAYASGTSRAMADHRAAGGLGAVMKDLLTFLGGDIAALRSRYDLAAKKQSEGLHLVARPRHAETRALMRRIEVILAEDGVSPRSVLLEETERDFVQIRFSKVERNVHVEPSMMFPEKG